jgi:hypothetical protein
MKKLALGIATAAVLFTAAPAMAQIGVRVGPFGFGVAPGPYYDNCGYWNNWCNGPTYYDYYGGDYYGGPNVVIGGGPAWHGHARWHHHR